jgi:hypothetical protein
VREAVGEGLVHTDDRPYIEFHLNRPVLRGSAPDNVRLMAMGREQVWPRLVNVPADREAAVKKRLERWFEATKDVIRGQHAAEILRWIEPGHAEYSRWHGMMLTAFRRARQLNPEDRNAVALLQDYSVRHEMMARLLYEQATSGTPR